MVCSRCVLPETYPGIHFDKDGVCCYCINAIQTPGGKTSREKNREKFLGLIRQYKGKNVYDCLVAFSGGKDSTYSLRIMKEEYGLKILAFTFDNGFQSERAGKNIEEVVGRLGVDHITFSPDSEAFRKMICLVISEDMFPMKAMERASSICTLCLTLIRLATFKMAIEKSIPFIVLGMSPGQAPAQTSIFKTNPQMIRVMQDTIYRHFQSRLGDIVKRYFLEERHYVCGEAFPYVVNPLTFLDYEEADIYKNIHGLGWNPPRDTDSNSTNCLLNALGNQIHSDKYHFHPYAHEISELVRNGHLSRVEGLERLAKPPDPKVVRDIRDKLGLD